MVEEITKLEEYAIENNIPIIKKDGLEFIINYILENNVLNILEIGSAIGYSAINFTLVNPNIRLTTLERDKKRFTKATKNIKKFKLENQIKIFNIDAFDYEDNNKYDLIFIDAAKAQNIKFFNKFKKNLNNKGVIVTDNLSFHGLVEDPSKTHNKNTKQLVAKIQKYIDFLKENGEFTTLFYKVGDGISISKKAE